jgi:FtsP/CotA-like multicopper oxidase with cupredoxin domain
MPFSGLTRRQAILGGAGLVAATAAAGWGVFEAKFSGLRLVAGRRTLEVDGKAAPVLGFGNHSTPLRVMRGEHFAPTLVNHLDQPTLVHWHGLTPPSAQDGVPGLSQPALAPGESYAYDFPLTRAGTFWMHSHQGLQYARLLAAPLIVADPQESSHDEQEVVMFLADFSFRPPEDLLAELTGGHGATDDIAGAPGMDQSKPDPIPAAAARNHEPGKSWWGMEVNDINFDAYLANDRTLGDPEVVHVEPGGRVRLRIINGASATNFWIALGTLSGELIAVDGDPVVPTTIRHFPLAIAQRIDLRINLPQGVGAYPIWALREGAVERAAIVLATPKAEVAKLPMGHGRTSRPLSLAPEALLVAAEPLPARAVDRTLTIDLTGDMESFVWGINGKRYGEDTPLSVRAGERVELVIQNGTAVAHPMHLHGHRFQVVAALDGRRFPGAMRDTVLVPAQSSVTIAFEADNPGKWALHCHNAYRMAAGMMTSLQYEA